jgi:hypothetical protein
MPMQYLSSIGPLNFALGAVWQNLIHLIFKYAIVCRSCGRPDPVQPIAQLGVATHFVSINSNITINMQMSDLKSLTISTT